MAARIAQPWRSLPTMRPKTLVSAAPRAKIGHHLDEVRQGGRVLEWMGRIGVEEPAAVGAQHLDRDLRRDRTQRDRLLGTFERRRLHIGRKRLRDPLPDQEQRIGNAKRQQHVEGAAGDIDPEVDPTVLTERGQSRG